MMIERIQSLSGKDGWKKPWFTEGALQWPLSYFYEKFINFLFF